MNRHYFIQTHELGTTIWFEEDDWKISFGETPGNRHYEEYLVWLSEGNTPETINEVE